METEVRRYNDVQKLQIIEEYMTSEESMETFQVKYGMGHSTLSRWMIKFGLSNTSQKQFIEMKQKIDQAPEKTLRERTLEAKVCRLEKELKEEKLKSLTYKTMVEVAEEELGIEIRKKSGAK
jgi:transposase